MILSVLLAVLILIIGLRGAKLKIEIDLWFVPKGLAEPPLDPSN
jgi:hypothetical protein